jgi:pyrrolidone-carboxylate peptidase
VTVIRNNALDRSSDLCDTSPMNHLGAVSPRAASLSRQPATAAIACDGDIIGPRLALPLGAAGALLLLSLVGAAPAGAAHTNNIMITGYWPNTNEMVRHFSTNPAQNPGGWEGENWRGLGYDIYSFFPEFPGQTGPNWGKGEGDFEVDYQDTSADWWRITEDVKPVAIITFSRGAAGLSWEVEARGRNRTSWTSDYQAPFQPTPSPPDASWPANEYRHSSLPMQNIVDAVNGSGLGVPAFIDSSASAGGTFLSEYIGYHGLWYQDIHSEPSDPAWNVAAGHIHVGIGVPAATGRLLTELSLLELIEHVNTIVPGPGSGSVLMLTGLLATRRRR